MRRSQLVCFGCKRPGTRGSNAMIRFTAKYAERLVGMRSGFDRLVFRGTLRRLYPLLVRHAMTPLGSGDVLRLLGRQVAAQGQLPATIRAEVTSEVQTRAEGVRIAHRVHAHAA